MCSRLHSGQVGSRGERAQRQSEQLVFGSQASVSWLLRLWVGCCHMLGQQHTGNDSIRKMQVSSMPRKSYIAKKIISSLLKHMC